MLKEVAGGITTPQGFKAAGVKAGIKKSGKEDVAIIYSSVPAAAAAVFTTNVMAAAPVAVSRKTEENGTAQVIVVNSGCANACTGEQGMADAVAMQKITAASLHVNENEVLVASTGIIGVNLPMEKIEAGIRQAVGQLSENGHEDALKAIMTTDTFGKSCAYELTLAGKTVKIAGIAKGAGMIHPNMATMLSFITTDAAVSTAVIKHALKEAVNLTFNMISVDGDTSTNDMVAVLANGMAGNPVITEIGSADYQVFYEALKAVCQNLAEKIVRDGEGATKFIRIKVCGAPSFEAGKTVAMSVAKSPLVKTAFFGQDPNWGRILCAVGYSGVPVNPEQTSLALGGITIVENGLGAKFDEQALKKVMAEHDIDVRIDLHAGSAEATVCTCDFSYEYVKINGEYHT